MPRQKSGRMYAGTKPGYEKASVYAGVTRLAAQVVAVVEDVAAGPDEREHRPRRAPRSTRRRAAGTRPGPKRAAHAAPATVEAARDVARERIVRRCLVGDEVEVLTAARELRHDIRRVAEQPDRERPSLRRGCAHTRERIVERLASPRRGSASRGVARCAPDRPRCRGSPHRPSSPRAAAHRPCPPRPAVRIVRPASDGAPKCCCAAAANVW